MANLEHLRNDSRFELQQFDINEPFDYGKIDYVFHFACPASPVDYTAHGIATLKVGSLGTFHALDVARKYGAKYFVSSTSECYGDPVEHPQKETYWGNVNPIGPRSVYDESKRFTEAVTMAYHRYHKLDTRIVRIFNTYGPRMQLNDGRVVPNFMKQALRGEDLTVYGDGSQTRSFCYVSDEIEGFLRLAKSEEHFPVNIGNPTEFTILECARQVLAVTGSKSKIRREPLPEMIPSNAALISRKHELCWDGNRRLTLRRACACHWITFVRQLASEPDPQPGNYNSTIDNLETVLTDFLKSCAFRPECLRKSGRRPVASPVPVRRAC